MSTFIGFTIIAVALIAAASIWIDQAYHAGYTKGYNDALDVAAEDMVEAFGLEEKK
jgi:hypothetical protein